VSSGPNGERRAGYNAGMAKLPFKGQATKALKGVRFDVYRVGYPKRGGGVMRREVVVPPDAAVILPVTEAGDIVLVRNRRPSVGRTLLELPAGTLEKGERPLTAAKRELPEETGYRAKTFRKLCAFYPSPGFCTEFMHVYLATDLTKGEQDLDETEEIEVAVMPLAKALGLIETGRIVDGKTIAALLYYRAFVVKGKG